MNPFPMWHFVIQEHLNSRSIQFCKLFCLFFAFPCMMGTMILYFFFSTEIQCFHFQWGGNFYFDAPASSFINSLRIEWSRWCIVFVANSVVEVVLYDCGTTEYTFTCVCVEGKCLKLLSFTHLRIDGGNIWCYNSPLDGKMSWTLTSECRLLSSFIRDRFLFCSC